MSEQLSTESSDTRGDFYEELSKERRRLLDRFESSSWCYVNPKDPGEAVLDRLFMVLFFGNYSPGTSTVCYVNPSAREEALLDQGPMHENYLARSILPGILMLIGIGGIFGSLRERKRAANESNHIVPSRRHSSRAFSGAFWMIQEPRTFRPAARRWKTLMFITAFCLIWNGATALFVLWRQ